MSAIKLEGVAVSVRRIFQPCLRYETLVADLQGESQRLIAFLGLDWQPACLDFHRTQRSVETASSWQVRQPLYTGSVGRWRHYERHLGRLLTALGARSDADTYPNT